jgi:type 1 fimbriae regulatory protein FimB/type 1 fimbriae regulatory protein FimE
MSAPKPRKYLTPAEVERVARAADRVGRHGSRNATLIKVMFRHGLRVSEAINLRREDCELDEGTVHVRRAKAGTPSTHPMAGWEVRALRKLFRQSGPSAYVFVSERGAPLTRRRVGMIVERAGKSAGFDHQVHPHMLRHACGFKLANDGVDTRTIQAWLGHRNIQHTVTYTELSSERLKRIWWE